MGPKGRPETSVQNYQSTRRKVQLEKCLQFCRNVTHFSVLMALNKSLINSCICPFYRGSYFLTLNCLVKEIYTQFIVKGSFSLYGAKVRSMSGPPHYRRFTITLRHATLLGLLWSGDPPHAETST